MPTRDRTMPLGIRVASRSALALVLAAVAGACGRDAPRERPVVAPRPSPVVVQAPIEPAAPVPEAARGPFEIHEWGLFGYEIDGAVAALATGVTPAHAAPTASSDIPRLFEGDVSLPLSDPASPWGQFAHPGGIGKPVLYVHLDPGVTTTTFDLALGIPRAAVREHWPHSSMPGESFGWSGIVARRGTCVSASAPPSARSAACREVSDHFCEAAEIPRYRGDDDTCLEVENEQASLLFYRADGSATASTSTPPLVLTRDGSGFRTRRAAGTTIAGPVVWVERTGNHLFLRVLGDDELDAPVPRDHAHAQTPDAIRALFVAYAESRGLSAAEADALVDAWSPAFFGACRRTGPEASGRASNAFAQADRSLLYFAPDAFVDAALPLATTPPARAIHRVFLVRWVDPTSRTVVEPATASPGPSTPLPTITPPEERVPRSHVDVRVTMDVAPEGRTASSIRTFLMQRSIVFRRCHDQQLRYNPEIAGTAIFELTVQPDGTVSRAEIASTTERSVAACMARELARVRFPVTSGTEAAELHVAVTFGVETPP